MHLTQGWRDDQLGHFASNRFGAVAAEDVLRRWIEFGDAPLMVNGDDGIKRCLQNRTFAGLALAHGFFGPLALDELPHLAADGGHHREQRCIGLPDLAAEEFDHAEQLTPEPNRKTT